MDINYLKELISLDYENEFVEFKHNWLNADELGEYISSISNAAALHGEDYGYFIWGIDDKTHRILGTSFNPDMDLNNEPLKHYLARNLYPSISFKFQTFEIDNKKIIVLIIPAAQKVITEFKQERFIRIGSSKEKLRKYPNAEVDLWMILKNGFPSIINTPSQNQKLTFLSLQNYFQSKGTSLNNKTYKDNLNLYVPNTKQYNLMALLLSDNNNITCRISVFNGKSKADKQYALEDFGNRNILVTIDQILSYLEAYNINMLNETNRLVERKDIQLFSMDCLREVVLNAFIHNDWTERNAPMITVYSNRIEVMSYGSLPSRQTKSGFYTGKSRPRCQELAELFLKLRISEKSGRGVTKVIAKYGKKAFKIEEDSITAIIPFVMERSYGSEIVTDDKNGKSMQNLNERLNKLLLEIRNNPNVTTSDLINLTGFSETSVENYIKRLKELGYIERVGSRKNGYWAVK